MRLQVYRSWAYWRYGGPVAQLYASSDHIQPLGPATLCGGGCNHVVEAATPLRWRLQPYVPEPATVSTGRRVLLGSEDKATFSAARLYICVYT